MRGCFVTGTDTGAGKTVVAAAIVASLRAGGTAVRALKPVITGLDDSTDPGWPHDHELLARISGSTPDDVTFARYGPPVSPHLAAELAGAGLRPDELLDAVLGSARDDEVLVVEGVGGLLVPLSDGYDVRQLARDLGLRLVIAARPGLGTINHTLLTIEAARAGGLEIAGVVLTPWPLEPTEIERSNRDTIELLGSINVRTLPRVAGATPELLAAAGDQLPLDQWL